jgi:hypothetical protein
MNALLSKEFYNTHPNPEHLTELTLNQDRLKNQ